MRNAQTALLAIVCLPALYLIHLLLLRIYSSPLLRADYAQCRSSYDKTSDLIHPGECPLIDVDEYRHRSSVLPLPTESLARFPAPTGSDRAADVRDTFTSYKHAQDCGLSSLDLHMPFTPLCTDVKSLLKAMSGGGRPGYDMPYIPLACDMRWYSTSEACNVLSRFGHVAFIGDSLMRHIVNAMYVFLREDIGYGAITDWNLDFLEAEDIQKKEDCKCAAQTGKHVCSDAVISKTSWIAGNVSIATESSPLACPSQMDVDISFTRSNLYPASEEELNDMASVLPDTERYTSEKPYAFVLHSTFWNNVNTTATVAWIDQITQHLRSTVPSLGGFGVRMNRLFVTANAGGLSKNAQYLEAQGNQQLGNFEQSITPLLENADVDVLGCFNMSLQSVTSDGTHASFGTNLLKAQMVLNWLDQLQT